VRIDHVLYAVSDLGAAASRFEDEFSLESVPGGEHPAWGTANQIVPLGPDYLELIGIADPAVAAMSELGRLVLDAGDRLVGWAVATDDLGAVARRLGLDMQRGSRTRTDGVRLAWRLAGLGEALRSGGALPFFIQWDGPAELHPGGDSSVSPGISWVEVGGDEAALREWLGGADLPVRFASQGRGITAVGIGDIVLV
jgi:glyoxalase-like protein